MYYQVGCLSQLITTDSVIIDAQTRATLHCITRSRGSVRIFLQNNSTKLIDNSDIQLLWVYFEISLRKWAFNDATFQVLSVCLTSPVL